METETLVRASQIDNIIGVKDAAGNLEATADLISRAAPGFYVWSGDDSYTLPLLSVGGYGVVCTCANIIGRQMRSIIDDYVAGRVGQAAATHRHLLPLMSALMTLGPNPVPVKHAMNKVGFNVGGVRLPLVDLDEVASQKLVSVLKQHTIDLATGVPA
jgi:4-hydroxy-tetrahydrodipicolinate synthase